MIFFISSCFKSTTLYILFVRLVLLAMDLYLFKSSFSICAIPISFKRSMCLFVFLYKSFFILRFLRYELGWRQNSVPGTFRTGAHGSFVFLNPLPSRDHIVFYNVRVTPTGALTSPGTTVNFADITYLLRVNWMNTLSWMLILSF